MKVKYNHRRRQKKETQRMFSPFSSCCNFVFICLAFVLLLGETSQCKVGRVLADFSAGGCKRPRPGCGAAGVFTRGGVDTHVSLRGCHAEARARALMYLSRLVCSSEQVTHHEVHI